MRVLVVDDDRTIRDLVKYSLELAGNSFTVETARTGQEAVNRLLQDGIDAVVMDIRMPPSRTAGIEATRLIREFSQVPVIILSAYGDDRTRKAAASAGATKFLTKPTNYSRLAALIKALAEGQRPRPLPPEITEKSRRLEHLKVQAARHGIDAPPAVLTEIEDLEREISQWQTSTTAS